MFLLLLYAILINLCALLLYTIDYEIYHRGGKGIRPEVLLNLITILGGSVGTLLAFLLGDFRSRKIKINKKYRHVIKRLNNEKYQSRIYAITWIFIHFVIFLILYGRKSTQAQAWIVDFITNNIPICTYILATNCATILCFTIDKIKAIRHRKRIPEWILLTFSVIGGSAGALLAMDLLNHKVREHPQFTIGIPMLIIAHLILLATYALGLI